MIFACTLRMLYQKTQQHWILVLSPQYSPKDKKSFDDPFIEIVQSTDFRVALPQYHFCYLENN